MEIAIRAGGLKGSGHIPSQTLDTFCRMASSIRLMFRLIVGLRQIQMSMPPNGQLKFCQSLGGMKNAVAEFDYDGVPPFYASGRSSPVHLDTGHTSG